MNEKTIIVHDASVYSALRKQGKLNRRFAMFAVAAAVYIFLVTKQVREQGKKLRELDPNAEKEEDRGFHIEF